ncbi:MAG: hypothetical protein KKA07_15755 [Bacteroidetes bacterium]|nr:hypothetical protein [Bacteroidota bacterium]MBU1720519.1 hypothetical protein [Bacteroidota bacterium]
MKPPRTIILLIIIQLVNSCYLSVMAQEEVVVNDIQKKYYEFADFPEIIYSKAELTKWTKTLKPISTPAENTKHIALFYSENQLYRIELISSPSELRAEVYSIFNDTMKCEVTGLTVSAPNFTLFIFKNDVLKERILYMGCSVSEKDNLTVDYCPYHKEQFEYWENTTIPKVKYVYFINRLTESEVNYRVSYNKSGGEVERKPLD